MTQGFQRINTPDELLQAYTTMFLLLGSSLSDSPSVTALSSYCHKGLLRNLPIESKNSSFLSASRLLMSPCPHHGNCSASISENYLELFDSEGAAQAKPIASVWDRKKREDIIDSLTSYYKRYHFEKSTCCDLVNDHLGIELLFVNMLVEKYLTEDDGEIKDMIKKDLFNFINTEMLPWVSRWSAAVTEKSLTKCYTGIAGLVVGSLEDVRDLLK